MRLYLTISLILLLTSNSATAQPPRVLSQNCLRRLESEVPAGGTVTVITVKGDTVTGEFATADALSSALYLRETSTAKYRHSGLVPVNQIQQVTFQKPSPARGLAVLLGLGIGGATGVLAGSSIGQSNSGGFGGYPKITAGVMGGFLGALIGSTLGFEVGKHMKATVTLHCW